MSKRKGPNKENLQETRDSFIQIAIREFTRCGYADASTSRIVDESEISEAFMLEIRETVAPAPAPDVPAPAGSGSVLPTFGSLFGGKSEDNQ